MPDPLTLGALTSLALGVGAEAALKGVVGEAVKDAYKALRERIVKWSEPEVQALERTPRSQARRAVIAEVVDSRPPEDSEALRALVENLLARLEHAAKTNSAAIDVETLRAARVRLGDITVSEGTGFRAGLVDVKGDFETGDIRVDPSASTGPRSSLSSQKIGAVMGHTVAGGDVLVGNRIAVRGGLHLHSQPTTTAGRVEVTDILVDSDREDFTAVLDIRLINRGDKSVSLSRAHFLVESVERIHTKGGLDFSASYDLDISDLRRAGDTAEVAISHLLRRDEADRFKIVLSAIDMPMGVFQVWMLRPTLATSEGAVTGPIVRVVLPWDITRHRTEPQYRSRK